MAWYKICLALSLFSSFALPLFARSLPQGFFDYEGHYEFSIPLTPFAESLEPVEDDQNGEVRAASPPSSQNLQREFLDPQNEARAEVKVEPMVWDDKVAAYAQNYANQRIGDCNLNHSGGPYGENIAWGSGDLSVADAVKMWIDEKVDYSSQSNTCAAGQVCGHYTQVISRNSVHMGCAKVRCDNGGTFITCNYDPPGNVMGESPF